MEEVLRARSDPTQSSPATPSAARSRAGLGPLSIDGSLNDGNNRAFNSRLRGTRSEGRGFVPR
jgi:hypothetical protein